MTLLDHEPDFERRAIHYVVVPPVSLKAEEGVEHFAEQLAEYAFALHLACLEVFSGTLRIF